jgi:hypothetical protein
MRERMKVGDLVVYSVKDWHKTYGTGLIVRTNPMYAFVKWSGAPPAALPFIANKEHLEVVNESR